MLKRTALRPKDLAFQWVLYFLATALLRWRTWANTPRKLIDIAISATIFTAISLVYTWWRSRRDAQA